MDLLNVQALFQKGIFSIPDYQRGYAWERDQIKDFLEDLEEAKDGNTKIHYTGAITVVKSGQKEVDFKTFDNFEVVDGQQRLTTFCIFISCFCNRLEALAADKTDIKEDIKDIRKNIIYKETPILRLNNQTDVLYQNYILKGSITNLPKTFDNKAQQNLANAKKQITKHLENEKNTIPDLKRLYNTLMSKFQVNFHILSDNNEVGIVFETMNNRGLPLTQMDKVKNYLIYLSNHVGLNQNEAKLLATEINEKFGVVFIELMKIQAITATQENDFLRYAFITYTGQSTDDVHWEIKKNLLPKREIQTTADALRKYVTFLQRAAIIYSQLKRAEIKNEKVKLLVQKILWLGNPSNFVPLLIALFETNIVLDDLVRVLEQIEVFSFVVYKLGGHKPITAQNELKKLASQVYKKEKTHKDVVSALKNNKYTNVNSFKACLEVDNFYSDKQRPAIAYLLYEYEQYLNQTELFTEFSPYTFEEFEKANANFSLQIEHILPQNPYWEEPSKHADKLGNLTLTFDNAALSNKAFPNKKEIYKTSILLCERKLVQYSKWDGTVINSRTKELIEFALKRWAFHQE